MIHGSLYRTGIACLSLAGTLPIWAEFRSIDGSGNHLIDATLGAAGDDIIRLGYPAAYPDGLGDVITDAGDLNARDVSNALSVQTEDMFNARGLSDWSVQWGQFITHDLDLTPTGSAYDTLLDGSTGDFGIAINDAFDPLGPNAIPFNRSQYQDGTGDGSVRPSPQGPQTVPRVLTNTITSYLDASMVYGSDDTRAAALRTFADGKLVTSADGLLPGYNDASLDNDDPFGFGTGLFLAGDVRANEQVGLTATHALFVREHNRLADALATADPTLDDETLYQTARKIVGAEIQAITYREYLPSLLGNAAPDADDFAYSATVDPRITSSFAVAAFRFGHSMQSGDIKLINDANEQIDALSLAEAFFDPTILGDNPEKVDLVLKGLATQTAQENDLAMHDALRNFLFGPPGAGGMDLMALDLERGRDHGLADVNALRLAYGLTPVRRWADVTSDAELAAELTALYGNNPNDADPFVVMLAEDHLPGASVGELTAAIIAGQFERLRDGDRLFFTGDDDLLDPLIASVIDLDTITLADIIRLNTDLTAIQHDVFFAAALGGLDGDFDGNGAVDQGDLNLVLTNWGTDFSDALPPTGWIGGGLAGSVDQQELNLVLNGWGSTTAPSFAGFAVPEPAAALALLPMLRRCRRSA
ncbi:MAG: peroxidase family protein [Planctomycetota bacterium]